MKEFLMPIIPDHLIDLLTREKKAFAFLALVKKDGTPQVTPVWFDYDGAHIVINTARGRVKDKILHRRPVVAMVIMDLKEPGRYLQISGQVVEETEEGAAEVIAALAEKYTGKREYTIAPGMVRVTYKILPERVQNMG
jgi:PPOX class probable F420-dependent enzyme